MLLTRFLHDSVDLFVFNVYESKNEADRISQQDFCIWIGHWTPIFRITRGNEETWRRRHEDDMSMRNDSSCPVASSLPLIHVSWIQRDIRTWRRRGKLDETDPLEDERESNKNSSLLLSKKQHLDSLCSFLFHWLFSLLLLSWFAVCHVKLWFTISSLTAIHSVSLWWSLLCQLLSDSLTQDWTRQGFQVISLVSWPVSSSCRCCCVS